MTNALHSKITCSDGHHMPLYCYMPQEGDIKAILHIAHGMAEYGQRYQPIAEILCGHGFVVSVHDQRGHGNAVASNEELGLTPPQWFEQQVEDMQLVVQKYRKLFPGIPLFILGHSMGSFLAQRYFQLYGNHINGLILSASNGKEDPLMGFGIGIANLQRKLFGEKYRSKLIDQLSFGQFNKKFKPNRSKADWLSRNNAEVDKYVADEKCGFVCSASFYYYFFKGIRKTFKKENIAHIPRDIPVYIFSGDKDPV